MNVDIPQSCPDIPDELMNPIDTWKDEEAYLTYARKLAKQFNENFSQKYPDIGEHIVNAGPKFEE